MNKYFFHFLQTHYDPTKPVLLGLSGGPDSLAILHLLLQYRENHPLTFGIAHVNHNWRAESKSEALQLKVLADELGVPFHLKELDPSQLQGNVEDSCRQERLRFFHALCQKHGYQAVLLGHHADDQAETVLKRVLEGANVLHLASLQSVNCVDGVHLWRPLLKVSKAEIISWLEQRQLHFFCDHTNHDPCFLRGRMRTQILPELTKAFGKEIKSSLCHLAEESQELRTYMAERIKPYLEQVEKGPHGLLLDLSTQQIPLFELKAVVLTVCHEAQCSLSRELVDTVCKLLIAKLANKQIKKDGSILHIDRGRLFIVQEKASPWKAIVKTVKNPSNGIVHGWKAAWQGYVEAILPADEYHFAAAQMNVPYPGSTRISKWWNDHKIPTFLRHDVPVVWKGSVICHEFLSGRNRPGEECSAWLHIQLTRTI